MLIGGLQKVTLIDYPSKIATVIFVQGCPFRCHFCHNSELVLPELFKPPISEKDVLEFLQNKVGKLEGVVISGGEPTCQKDLVDFSKKIKAMGFLIKLDTSGINPHVIEKLLKLKLIDYIAMDIKAPLKKYFNVTGKEVDIKKIKKSISLIIKSSLPHEFRTTLIEELHTLEDIIQMAKLLKGADIYILQKFVSTTTLNPSFNAKKSFTETSLLECQKAVENYLPCQIR